jgi:ATP-dependent DNA helicase RecG
MTIEKIYTLLKQGEGTRLEFKEAKFALPKTLFESICAMLNNEGGNIFLGVDDSGTITGVLPEQVDKMIKDLTYLSNDPQKMNPPFVFTPKKYMIGGQWVIHILLPADSQVHRLSNVVYFRNGDADLRINEPQKIAEIVNKKNSKYTENAILSHLRFEDFKADLFPKVRNLIRSNNADHPWLALDNTQLLRAAGLWKRDFQTGEEGYTLAAALLLGEDEVITQVLPHYKIDALVRIENTFRYDDRAYIQTNLVEAYEQLLDFVGKHLPDKFHLEGSQRVSLRTAIFREVIANMIVHREYTSAYPCRFIIGKDTVETENANKPNGEGIINPLAGITFPKNPVIVKFFIQLGRAEELGSGARSVAHYTKMYAGKRKPEFVEGNIFKMKIPILVNKDEGVNAGVNAGVSEGVKELSSHLSSIPIDIHIEPVVVKTVNRLFDEEIGNGNLERLKNANKSEIMRIVMVVNETEGLKSGNIAERLGKPQKTIERQISKARELNILRFVGPPKTGGYYFTEFFENRIIEK